MIDLDNRLEIDWTSSCVKNDRLEVIPTTESVKYIKFVGLNHWTALEEGPSRPHRSSTQSQTPLLHPSNSKDFLSSF